MAVSDHVVLQQFMDSVKRRKEDDLQQLLRDIMTEIHKRCVEHGRNADDDYANYVKGANIAAFIKVADAMLAYGVV